MSKRAEAANARIDVARELLWEDLLADAESIDDRPDPAEDEPGCNCDGQHCRQYCW